MRKNILTIIMLSIAIVTMAKDKEESSKGAHPYKVAENEEVAPKFSHWSLTPHVGFNYFDGDFNSEMKHAVAIPNAGLDLEYSFTPVWGVGLNYMFDMYNVTGKPGANNADTLLNGMMHKASLYVSMDFMNLFFPQAKKKIFSLHAIVGGGYAWYKTTKMYHDNPSANPTWKRGNTLNYINEDGRNAPSYMTDYSGELFLHAGMAAEFNLNRTLGLGVRATYSYFIHDYIDGRGYAGMNAVASKNNDGIVDVTLYMRFKLMAVSQTHMRNISNPHAFEKEVKQQPVHDTVIIKHDSIIVREHFEHYEKSKELEQYYYVYFQNNKALIDDKGLITIQQVAERLQEDTTLYAVVTGYCDNTGSNKLNYALGDKRAENVMDELAQEHGIDTERMYSMGMGKVIGRRSQAAYGPNRRAAIRLVDKATFERMKANLDDQRSRRDESAEPTPAAKPSVRGTSTAKTVPLSQTAKKETKPNEYQKRQAEEVMTEKTTTLSKLARQYYGNTYCWVYIYIANKDKISNPNSLTPGTTLVIPELTEQEMQITKDQGLVLYYNARQNK